MVYRLILTLYYVHCKKYTDKHTNYTATNTSSDTRHRHRYRRLTQQHSIAQTTDTVKVTYHVTVSNSLQCTRLYELQRYSHTRLE